MSPSAAILHPWLQAEHIERLHTPPHKNNAFVYTIVDLYDTSQDITTSNVGYKGANLTDCQVNDISISADFIAIQATWEMNIKCTFDDGIELLTTAQSLVDINSDLNKNLHTMRASQATRLMTMLRDDAHNSLLLDGYINNITTMFHLFHLQPNGSIEWDRGLLSNGKLIWRGQGRIPFRLALSVTMIENYVYLWAGLALSDLGVGSQQNVLTSSTALKEHVKPLNWSLNSDEYQTNVFLRGDLGEYGLPLNENHPVGFNAYYLCEYISWKAGISLVIDVFVATASLFMAFWGILNLALRFWATRSSEKSKHCICSNCENALAQDGGSITSAHDISKEGLYSRVPVSADV
ncbi:hypothetical protein RhiJN_16354 [Ceratobasidium sp. AG-Ba]|nr:hypothetical protein RhiJN_16354 [Ceratobasidium sp. AG-Ba]